MVAAVSGQTTTTLLHRTVPAHHASSIRRSKAGDQASGLAQAPVPLPDMLLEGMDRVAQAAHGPGVVEAQAAMGAKEAQEAQAQGLSQAPDTRARALGLHLEGDFVHKTIERIFQNAFCFTQDREKVITASDVMIAILRIDRPMRD